MVMMSDLNKKRENSKNENVDEISDTQAKDKSMVNKNDLDSVKLKTKKNKRKKSHHSEIAQEKKRSKSAKIVTEDNTEESINDNNDNDAKKPKSLSNNQKKKLKAEMREIEKRDRSKKKAAEKALQYISTWKYARTEWKFAKLQQIWLMDNLLDENTVSDSTFPTVLEYFESCKGMARETLLKKGMDIIKTYEQKSEESDDISETVELKRARQLLQALPTET